MTTLLPSATDLEESDTKSPKTSDFNSAPALACASALFILGSLSTLITPALLQGWADQFQWAEARLGWIAMLELAGLALGSVSAFYWQRRYNWRRVSGWAIIVIIGLNLGCLLPASFSTLCLIRFASGAAGGVLVGVYTAYLSNTRSPEKFLAVTTLAQIVTQAVLMSLSSVLLDRWGMNAIYIMLAASVAILLPTMRFLPVGWPTWSAAGDDAIQPASLGRHWTFGLLVLAAFVPFEIFQGGAFAFLPQFGLRGAGLGSGEALHIVGLAVIGSGAGPIAAYFLADRLGILVPLAGSMVVMLAMIIGLTTPPYSAFALLLYLSVMQAAWLFATCYLFAGLIKVNNVLTQAASPLSAICLAAGASLMGMTIEGHGLTGIFWLSLICLVLAAVFVLPPLYAAGRKTDIR